MCLCGRYLDWRVKTWRFTKSWRVIVCGILIKVFILG